MSRATALTNTRSPLKRLFAFFDSNPKITGAMGIAPSRIRDFRAPHTALLAQDARVAHAFRHSLFIQVLHQRQCVFSAGIEQIADLPYSDISFST